MPKGRKYLYITAFFYCLKTLIPWFAITWPGFQVKKWCFFADVFAEFVRKHIIISFLADSRLLSRFCVADYQAEGNAFVLAHLHGRRDVSYKPAIQQTSHLLRSFSGTCRVRQGLPPLLRPNTRVGLCAWRLHIPLNLVFPVVLLSYNMIYNNLPCTNTAVCRRHLFTRKKFKMRNDTITAFLKTYLS